MAWRRARLKENLDLNAIYLEKDWKRKKAQRDKVKEFDTEEDIRESRRKESKRVLGYYYKKKSEKNKGEQQKHQKNHLFNQGNLLAKL